MFQSLAMKGLISRIHVFKGLLVDFRAIRDKEVKDQRLERLDDTRLWLFDLADFLQKTHEVGINLSYQCDNKQLAMQNENLIEEQQSPIAVERLLNQNKMNELALKKATNLIELLNIQLEVERNTNQENLRILEQQLKSQHENQIRRMQQQIDDLQLQLKRKSQTSIDIDRTIRKTSLTRAYSAKSAGNFRRKNGSKKHTETLVFEEAQISPVPPIQVSLELYKQNSQEFNEWKRNLSQELEQLINGEYDELQKLINRIEESSQQCRGLGNSRLARRNMDNQLSSIIRSQNTLINGLLSYAQQLEDLCKSTHFQLNSLLSTTNQQINPFPSLQIKDIASKIKKNVSLRDDQFRLQIKTLKEQNGELKNILESLINIVKVEKNIK